MPDIGVTVIGGGVVGLAIAARLAPRNPDLVILERYPKHGQETSSRNSEVIHGGMYYPAGSLKARLCVEGNRAIYEICEAHAIPHKRCGKVITATEESELPALDRILALGTTNGVELRRISAGEAHDLEPNIRSAGALFAPNTGVVSAHGLMDYFFHVAVEAGAVFQPRSEVVEIEKGPDGYRLAVRAGGADASGGYGASGGAMESFTTERVINAAGLEADTVSALAGIDVDAAGYRLHYCKGSYFSVASSKAGLVSRLVYPVPSPVSLGIHALVDMAGRMKFGPDAEYLPDRRLDYRVDEAKLPAFGRSVRKLVPAIGDDDLAPDMSGIRPKLQAEGEPAKDFVIREESDRGLPGFFNLVGIDSPGLTSSPAIARHVEALMNGRV
jgi:L-2-hydroxyglutarate oxidase LhgO